MHLHCISISVSWMQSVSLSRLVSFYSNESDHVKIDGDLTIDFIAKELLMIVNCQLVFLPSSKVHFNIAF